MAFNGSGIFNRLYNWVQDAANGIAITASRMDAETQGIADGLSNCITKDGQSAPSADIPFNNHQLLNVSGITTTTTLALPQSQASTLLINNSASATSNVFDWTEKNGTFTPAIVGGSTTYIARSGYYTRLANECFGELTITWTNSTAGSPFYINALPFTAISTTTEVFPVWLQYQNFTAGTYVVARLLYNAGSPQIVLEEISNGTTANPLTVSTGALQKTVKISFKYRI